VWQEDIDILPSKRLFPYYRGGKNMKKISAVAINTLKEALSAIYWFKSDLRSFLLAVISDNDLLSRINWDEYKINICGNLITYMQLHEESYQKILLKLIAEIVRMNDFSHLEKLDGGHEKAQKAKNAVNALREISKTFVDQQQKQEELEQKRREEYEKLLKNQELKNRIEEIKKEYFLLISSDDPQGRGFKLEKIIKELFEIFDLDPKASFRIIGEQIDGAFTFETTDYLFEAKWTKELISIEDLDAFAGKLSRKLENTLGLFLSINGFSEDAIKAHTTGRKLMILMDGSDLMAVLEGRIDLMELLYRKKRYASQTGNIYLRIHEIIQNIDKLITV
jgi:restriction endonuclease Mrr